MKKSLTAAVLIALSAFGVGTLAHAEEDDPSTYQLNRWGVPATPENIARYQLENGITPRILGAPGLPYGYYPNGYYPHANVLQSRGVPLRNWRRIGLAAPPAGYQWWRVGNEYVLADRSTGAIAQVVR
jgi:hypothetical protein